jgi:hypothetical protein
MIALTTILNAQTDPIVNEDLVLEETDGLAAVEAEFFYKQSLTEIRQWYIYSKDVWPKAGRDDDDPHCVGASNNSYIEILPDTRASHADKLIGGENFSNEPGKLAVVHYKVHFNTPGRYYVWVRAYSTGIEDNGIHVGLDGQWPESGQRMQWCSNKMSWHWESKQRTEEVHCGVPHLIYLDVDKKGPHEIMFSLREDGFEFDKFLLTTDRDYVPPANEGPEVKVKKGKLPDAFPVVREDLASKRSMTAAVAMSVSGARVIEATAFPVEGTNFYVDGDWLAINPGTHKEATTFTTYNAQDGTFDVVFLGVGEDDGASEFTLQVNETIVGSYKTPLATKTSEEAAKYCHVFKDVSLTKGDKISVLSKVGSKDGSGFSRARWAGVAFIPPGTGEQVLEAIDRNANAEIQAPTVWPVISGELKMWHKVSLTFDGPETSETDDFNPFMNYRFNVTFSHPASGKEYLVPGYFAADGNAGNSSAETGNKWRVHFATDETGTW